MSITRRDGMPEHPVKDVDGPGSASDPQKAPYVRFQLSGLMEAELARSLSLGASGGARRLIEYLRGRKARDVEDTTTLRQFPWLREEDVEVMR